MKYRLEVQLEAIIDIRAAFKWYEDKRQGLGLEFITEIEECYLAISENPEHYGFVNGSSHFRRIRVYRFPYIIVFEVWDALVIVTHVKHIKQDRTYI